MIENILLYSCILLIKRLKVNKNNKADNILTVNITELLIFKQAMTCINKDFWYKACKAEIKELKNLKLIL